MRYVLVSTFLVLVVVLTAPLCYGASESDPFVLEGNDELILDGQDLECIGRIELRDQSRLLIKDASLILSRYADKEDWGYLQVSDNASLELVNVQIEGDVEGLWISAFDDANVSLTGLQSQFGVEGAGGSQVDVQSCDLSELRVRDHASVRAEDTNISWTIDFGLWDMPSFELSGLSREAQIERRTFGPDEGFPFFLDLTNVTVNGWSLHIDRNTDVHLFDSIFQRIVLLASRANGTLTDLRPQLYESWTFPDDIGLDTDVRVTLENTEMADHWVFRVEGNADLVISDCQGIFLDFANGYGNIEIVDSIIRGLSFYQMMGDVLFENTMISEELSIEDTVWLTMDGSVSFGADARVERWENSMVQRTFPIRLTRKDGSPAADHEITVVLTDGSIKKLVTNGNGDAVLTVIFDDKDFSASLPLSVDPGDRPIHRDVGFLAATPLAIDFLRASVDLTSLYVGSREDLGFMYPPESRFKGHVYETLFMLDPISRPIALLATVVPSTKNGGIVLTEDGGYQVRIGVREGLVFHSGEPVSMGDIEYCIELGLVNSANENTPDALEACGVPDLGLLIEEAGAEAATHAVLDAVLIDGNEIVMELERPYSGIWAFLADVQIAPRDWQISRGMWDGTPESLENFRSRAARDQFTGPDAMGTGPFILSEISSDQRDVTLARNPSYWGTMPSLSRVYIRLGRSADELFQLLASESIDVATGLLNDELHDGRRLLDALPEITTLKPLITADRPGTAWGLFNQVVVQGDRLDTLPSGQFSDSSAPVDLFSDVDVRLGFLHGFDWETFLPEAAMDGQIYRPVGSPVSPFLYQPLREGVKYSYDPVVAMQHFSRAWEGQLLDVGFTSYACFNGGNDRRRQFCSALTVSLRSLDPRFEIDVYDPDFNTLVDDLFEDELPLIVLGLTEGLDILGIPYVLLHSESLAPWGASVPAFDELLDDAAWTFDLDRRDSVLVQVREMVSDDPIGFFWRNQEIIADQEWLRGIDYDPFYAFGQIPRFDLRSVWKESPN